jgi:hypothetical protein
MPSRWGDFMKVLLGIIVAGLMITTAPARAQDADKM